MGREFNYGYRVHVVADSLGDDNRPRKRMFAHVAASGDDSVTERGGRLDLPTASLVLNASIMAQIVAFPVRQAVGEGKDRGESENDYQTKECDFGLHKSVPR